MRFADKVLQINPELAQRENPDYEKFHWGLNWVKGGTLAVAAGVAGDSIGLREAEHSALIGAYFLVAGGFIMRTVVDNLTDNSG